jgi:carbon-monoxide dehydrogenase medium subunit
MKPALFEFVSCSGVAETATRLAAADGRAKVCGGSQSLGPMLNLRLVQPEQLIDVSRFAALRTWSFETGVLRIGAAVTHGRIEDGELVDATRGLLPHVAGGIAYRAVRNRGTLGGSLAHADPAADWVSAMSLLDARLVVVGAQGERRIPIRDFFDGPFGTALTLDEVIVVVEVQAFSASARWAWRKVSRKPGEFAEAIAGVLLDPARDVARVVLGALDRMPLVVDGRDAVEALRSAAGVERVLDDTGLDDPYKRQLQAAMLRRALADLDAFPA